MGVKHLAGHSSRVTPQSEAIPGTSQVPNSAGGYAWGIDHWQRLRRFLVLGSEGGSYYATEQDLTKQNVDCLRTCLADDPRRVVDIVVEVSVAGRAPKNDPAILALAMAASLPKDPADKAYALDALPRVCRIGTHLFHFAMFVEQHRGWGRGLKNAVARWYEGDLDDLALQAVKYRQRDGWSHRDLLRLSHPKAPTLEHKALYDWICGREGEIGGPDVKVKTPLLVQAFVRAQTETDESKLADLIIDHRLPREALPTESLTKPAIWDALLPAMPMGAMVRNLANMTRLGVLDTTSAGTRLVLDKLRNEEQLRKSRIHPIQVLAALLTYKAGRSARGSNTWSPVTKIVDALDEAFYTSFGNLTPAGKRTLLALDVSGSMGMGEVAGVPNLTPRVASAAMAMVTLACEDMVETIGFTGGKYGGYGYGRRTGLRYLDERDEVAVLSLSARRRLDDVVREIDGLPMGGTDCALPMIWAQKHSKQFDTFIVYTDNETWAGSVHPSQALVNYRQATGIPARLIVVGMVSNEFTIADPNDAGMCDIVGFDTSAPQIISDFSAGNI